MIWCRKPSREDVEYVVRNMREWNRKEVCATRWSDDPDELVDSLMLVNYFAWVVGIERPIAMIGAVPVHPGVWNVFGFGTDEVNRLALWLTKHYRRVMIPALQSAGAHRIESHSMDGHPETERLLKNAGAHREGTLAGYGKNREDFGVYVWRV